MQYQGRDCPERLRPFFLKPGKNLVRGPSPFLERATFEHGEPLDLPLTLN